MHGANEGRGGGSGIPRPGTESDLAIVGARGDGGGVHVLVEVTDATPICNALHLAGKARGLGLLAKEPISKGAPVIEYVGELLTRSQAESREHWYKEQGRSMSYALFTELHGNVIDATLYGNAARFMNASCEPNLRQAKLVHERQNLPRVIFHAARDIEAGEELTWKYHTSSGTGAAFGYSTRHPCYCGAAQCSGFLA